MPIKVFLALLCFTLVGCVTVPEIPRNDQLCVATNVPSNLREQNIPPRPISEEEYMALSKDDREGYVMDYASTLMSTIAACNVRANKILDLVDRADQNNKAKQNVSQP